jgi:phosphatidylglycerophosphate synthase
MDEGRRRQGGDGVVKTRRRDAYSLEEIRVKGKRELFRAGPRMRFVMPRISVRCTRWILNHAPSTTPNQVTFVSAVLGMAAGVLLVPTGIGWAVAAFIVYQLHILTDYIDGEIARVRDLASVRGSYYDLMVGRYVKPVVLYGGALGAWMLHRNTPTGSADLILGALAVTGFLLDKEAVDVWYRSNTGRGEIEDPYVVRSDHAIDGARRVLIRIVVGIRSIPAFLGYQIAAAVLLGFGIGDDDWHIGTATVTPRSIIVWFFAITFPALAILRAVYIARTGHIPRRQDLVAGDD